MSGSRDVKCLVLFSYEGQEKDELSINEGDIVSNVFKSDCGWWHGCLGSREGVFPENHVRVLQGTDDTIGMSSCLNYVVTYDYNPVKKDELKLVVGEVVEKVGELEPGWWKGISRGRYGVFPSSFVKYLKSETEVPSNSTAKLVNRSPPTSTAKVQPDSKVTPPTISTKSVTDKSSVGSTPTIFNSRPISANLFAPEDEPIGPLFGSLSSQLDLEENWSSTASLKSCSNKKPGLFDRIRHSFGGKSIFSKFTRNRLSSGSLVETRSINSPFSSRRNSFAAFFKRSSVSMSGSKHDVTDTEVFPRLRTNTMSCDKSLTSPSLVQSPPVTELQGDFRKVSLSSDIKRISSRDPEPSLSWVFQEVGSKTTSGVLDDKKLRKSSGDSGVDECEPNEPEKFFGPIDITDEIFEDMFSPIKSPKSVCEDPTTYENIFHFSEVDSDLERITEL